MGWSEYYRSVQPVSLNEQGYAYVWSLDILTRQTEGFLKEEKITALLGGFHAYSHTSAAFPALCRRLHPHPEDRLILFDMNEEPLKTPAPYPKIRGRLEELPFSDGSLDLIILDHTLDFMNDQQVRSFAGETRRVLSPEGVVLAAFHDGLFSGNRIINTLQRVHRSSSHRVSYYPRSLNMISALVTGLIINLEGVGKCFRLLALSQPQSPYPVFTGDPFALYQDLASSEYFFPAAASWYRSRSSHSPETHLTSR